MRRKESRMPTLALWESLEEFAPAPEDLQENDSWKRVKYIK